MGAQRLAGHAALYGVASVVPIVTAIAITPAVTRTLGSSEYGMVASALVVLQVTSLLCTLGLPAAITRHALIERSGRSGAGRLVLVGALLAAACGAVVAAASVVWWPVLMDNPWRVAVVSAVAAGSMLSVVTCYQSLLRAEERPVAFAVSTAALSLGGQAAGLLAARVWSGSAEAYLSGMAVAYAVVVCVVLLDSSRVARLHAAPEAGQSTADSHRSDLARALRVSLPTVPHSLAMLLTTGAAITLASRMFDHREAGQVQLMLLVGTAPSLALTALNNLWAPAVYRATPGRRGRLVGATVTKVTLAMGVLALALSLGAPLALRWLAPPSMMADAPQWAVCVAALAVLPAVAYLGNVHILFAEARATSLAVLTPVSLLVAVALSAWSARVWGLAGLLLVPTVFYLCQAVSVSFVRRRTSREDWGSGRQLALALALATAIGSTALLPYDGPAAWFRAGMGLALLAGATALAHRYRRALLGPLG
jgi:O-antigen/teichoic acid export membrane protein